MRRTLFVSLWIAGCTAHIPDGVYACEDERDCPSGFECREGADGSYCSRPDAEPGSSGHGGAGAAGSSGAGGAGGAGGPSTDAGSSEQLVPREIGFRSLGGVRSGGGVRVYDEHFEISGRSCSADRHICLTGGFEP